jgi:hypothetical protein
MRKMSAARRRVVVMAGSLAAMSGVGPLLFQHNRLALGVWAGLMLVLLACVIVLMARLRRDEGCE